MKVYDFSQVTNVKIYGNIYGDIDGLMNMIFDEEKYRQRGYKPRRSQQSKKMTQQIDKLCIVCGDTNIGFKNSIFYRDKFDFFNSSLSSFGVVVLFIRGNHDNPSYFNGENFNFSNIKTIEDYSIVKVFGNNNILCIGGGWSCDKSWRKEQEERINKFRSDTSFKKKLFWDDERPIYDEEKLNEIFKEKINISFVCSHDCPSFVGKECHKTEIDTMIDQWSKNDDSLLEYVAESQESLDKVYDFLLSHKNNIVKWYYSHYHVNKTEKIGNTEFICNGNKLTYANLSDSPWSSTSYLKEASKLHGLDYYPTPLDAYIEGERNNARIHPPQPIFYNDPFGFDGENANEAEENNNDAIDEILQYNHDDAAVVIDAYIGEQIAADPRRAFNVVQNINDFRDIGIRRANNVDIVEHNNGDVAHNEENANEAEQTILHDTLDDEYDEYYLAPEDRMPF